MAFGWKKKSKHFTLRYCLPKNLYRKNESNLQHRVTKLGFILPKKLIKSSVCRNLLKRWARHILRDSKPITDIVMLINVPLSFKTNGEKKELYLELLELFRSI